MKFIHKLSGGVVAASMVALSVVSPAFAHVKVNPDTALAGAYQTFTVSAPNEKDIAFTTIKLDIPDTISSVTPTVKPGWVITTEKSGEGETAKVTSITWSEGNVGGGLRDEFSFSAKLPDDAGEVIWKAYQTYEDGTVVSWNQKEESDKEGVDGPYSVTNVTAEDETAVETKADDDGKASLALYTSIAALVVSLGLVGFVSRKK